MKIFKDWKLMAVMGCMLVFLLTPVSLAFSHDIPVVNYCEPNSLIEALEDVQHNLQHHKNHIAKAKLYTIRSYMKSCDHPLTSSTDYIATHMWTKNKYNEWAYGKVETLLILLRGNE